MIDNNADTSIVVSASRAIDGAISRLVQGMNSVAWNPVAESERFQVVRENTLAILGEVTNEQASWSPKKGIWSIAQIADHLLLSEEMYRDQFRRLVQVGRDGG